MSFRASSAILFFASVAFSVACSSDGGSAQGSGGSSPRGSSSTGGFPGSGGVSGLGGTPNTGGIMSTGGISSSTEDTGRAGASGLGGTSVRGGATSTGGTARSGGASSTGTILKTGGGAGTEPRSSGGTIGSGGTPGSGGSGKGGTTGTGEIVRRDAGPDTGTDAGDGGRSICSTPMPTEGGKTYTGNNVGVTIDGFHYGIWSDGSGGSITVFPSHAFSARWSESRNFLAHAGLDYRTPVNYTTLGTVVAEFSEKKSGTAGSWSMIGMYGWTQNPCVEWYISEDSWHGMAGTGGATATIDGATYTLTTLSTTGTGGANACGQGYSGPWTQMKSTRKSARTCGTITVSDHFAAWAAQGWKLGGVTSIHINVEVGGGTGTIEFPVANITTTGK